MHKVYEKSIPFLNVKMFRLQKLRTLHIRYWPRVQHDEVSPSLYKVLGVNKNATQEEIKSAYFALSRKFHPDFNIEFDTKLEFMKVQNAYKILSIPLHRSAYDNASNNLSDLTMYHNIYRTHVHTPHVWEHSHHFHHFNRHHASDPPPTKKQEISKIREMYRSNYITINWVVVLFLTAGLMYGLLVASESGNKTSSHSKRVMGTSPLRDRPDLKPTDLAKYKELDIPRREESDK